MSIKYIDIIHHSHTDFGYTDYPDITRELHKKYIYTALEYINQTKSNKLGERFCWTAETLLPVYDWLQEASEEKRNQLFNAIEKGCLEVQGLMFNNTPFMNDDEWDKMFDWIPEEIWNNLKITSGMQNDVNGMPIAGVMRAVKKGITHLWIGPNSYNGKVPFDTPFAFKWLLPNGNSIFVWLNSGYCDGYFIFNENWRIGPVPDSNDLRYRQPIKGDFFKSDEKSILEAHSRCIEQIKIIEGTKKIDSEKKSNSNTQIVTTGGYKYDRLLVSFTNQWRIDNDPPFLPLVDFIKQWNQMGLKPELRLVTPSVAMKTLESEIGDTLPQYSGEWTDWWANGSASAPIEISASRKAKRIVKAIKSEAFGNLDIQSLKKLDEVVKELCLYDEHTWGSWQSISNPYSVVTIAQSYYKGLKAFKSLAYTQMLISDIARNTNKNDSDGIYVTNTSDYVISNWVELPSDCLRDRYNFTRNTETDEVVRLIHEEGIENFIRPESPEQFSFENVSHTFIDRVPEKKVKFWSGFINPKSRVYFELLKNYTDSTELQASKNNQNNIINITKNSDGWPLSAIWNEMNLPLFENNIGDFISYSPIGFAPRWILKDIFNTEDKAERMSLREKNIQLQMCCYNETSCIETDFTFEFQQHFSHPSLEWGFRQIVLFKNEARARVNIKIFRKSSMEPEIYYIKFQFPCKNLTPNISNGGQIFRPGVDQLEGSCMDFYAIDGFVHYKFSGGNWLWNSSDAPLITFEKPQAVARLDKLPDKTEVLLSMVFDNTWDTNFVADSHGIMEFRYDIMWKSSNEELEADKLANSLASDLVIEVKVK